MVNLLIPYVPLYNHNDPVLDEFTYGDVGSRARKLKRDLTKGDFVFLHTTLRDSRYITAYYVVDKVLDTSVASANYAIITKYKNIHLKEYLNGERRDEEDTIVFGDPILSYNLARPLLFNKKLAEKLSLNIRFKEGFTENQCIASATRAWRELSKKDVKILLSEIQRIKSQGFDQKTILSTDEVMEILEADLENFLEKNPKLIGDGLKLTGRQIQLPVGRIDLLFENSSKELIVVELKLGAIGTDAINQIRRYINHLRKETKQTVSGVIVCKSVMPAFQEKFKNLKNIKILFYGWKLVIHSKDLVQ